MLFISQLKFTLLALMEMQQNWPNYFASLQVFGKESCCLIVSQMVQK
jgi:hypothetical protein